MMLSTHVAPASLGLDGRRLPGVLTFGEFELRVAERLLLNKRLPVALSGRSFDLLVALVEHSGRVLSKKELINSVWLDETVDDASLRVHIAILRKTLGQGTSSVKYIATLQGRGYSFVAPVSRHSSGLSATVSQGDMFWLPMRSSPLIGRDEVVTAISARIMTERLVSIVGPGGMGKTAVSTVVADRLRETFDGLVLIDFGPLSEPQLLPSLVASSLNVNVQNAEPIPAIIAFLQGKRFLTILDNCEHVVEAVVALTEKLLAATSGLHIIATSREALRADGEHVFPLASLEIPPEKENQRSEDLLSFASVRLFIERAVANGFNREPSLDDALAASYICRQLDGIPLAIELVAGRVNVVGIQGAARLLKNGLDPLWEGRRPEVPRHRTLRAALDWSYDLLNDIERMVLRRMSIFAGSLALDSALAVIAGDGLREEDVVDGIIALVEKSLVSVDIAQGSTRYRLLQTTRAYVFAKLQENEEFRKTARKHAIFHLEMLHSYGAGSSLGSGKRLRHFADQLADVRAALEWGFLHRDNEALGVAIAAASAPFFLEFSLMSECGRWSHRALEQLEDAARGTDVEARLQSSLGLSLMYENHKDDRARVALERSLELSANLSDFRGELQTLAKLNILYQRTGDFSLALRYAEHGLSIAQRCADIDGVAEAHATLGISLYLAGDAAGARVNFEAALGKRTISSFDPSSPAFNYQYRARVGLAGVQWLQGETRLARANARMAAEEAMAGKHPVVMCVILTWVIWIALWDQDNDNIDRYAEIVVRQAKTYALGIYEAIVRGVRGELLIRQGEAERGIAETLAALDALREAGYELFTGAFLAIIAGGLCRLQKFEDALKYVDDASAVVDRGGNLYIMPEILRVKGDILAAMTSSVSSEADTWLDRAHELARTQGAFAWELRIAISVAKLRQSRGEPEGARRILQDILARSQPDFKNRDREIASSLLQELG